MSNPTQQIIDLLRRDRRYKFDAYAFMYEALDYAHTVLRLGADKPAASAAEAPPESEEHVAAQSAERHLTGQQLCEAIRLFALEQYGLMAKNVLNSWGIYSTSDFGEIVYNLIGLGLMRKTESDRREDFDNVYDFETELTRDFKITLPDAK